MTNEAFIRQHLGDDVHTLVLRGAPEGVNIRWCAQQIEGYHLAQRKIPHWTAITDLHYGPRLSMEQCSSWETAWYKKKLIERLVPAPDRHRLADLTGGLAVDFSALAPLFRTSLYVECQSDLCDLARHNLPLLGLPEAEIIHTDRPEAALWQRSDTVLFLDPARRDKSGRKTVALSDCVPNVLDMQADWTVCPWVMLKLSPMLDIAAALRQLRGVFQVHVLSVCGECKELLLVLRPGEVRLTSFVPSFHCVNIVSRAVAELDCFDFMVQGDQRLGVAVSLWEGPAAGIKLLFEPGAGMLKAQLQDSFALFKGMLKLHPQSNLFVPPNERLAQDLEGYGRVFRVVGSYDFSKASLRLLQRQVSRANLTLRNFPSSVEALRHRLKLRDGGADYLFATTLSDGSHIILRCEKFMSGN